MEYRNVASQQERAGFNSWSWAFLFAWSSHVLPMPAWVSDLRQIRMHPDRFSNPVHPPSESSYLLITLLQMEQTRNKGDCIVTNKLYCAIFGVECHKTVS